jgi:hypothetical protein
MAFRKAAFPLHRRVTLLRRPVLAHASEGMHSPLLTLLTTKAEIALDRCARVGRPVRHRGDTIAVTSCDDDGGFDTLRHAVLIANPGDTIDLRSLACSTLTLQAGAIAIGLNDLTILGPGANKLTIDGNQAGRVFNHTNDGKLTLSNLTIAHGKVEGDKAYGGCIFSKGGRYARPQRRDLVLRHWTIRLLGRRNRYLRHPGSSIECDFPQTRRARWPARPTGPRPQAGGAFARQVPK